MLGIIVGLIVFLIILAGAYKFGNPDNYVQKKNNKYFIDDVANEINKLMKD